MQQSIAKLKQALQAKQITPTQLVEQQLEQIQNSQDQLNSFITIDEQGAKQQAQRVENGQVTGPLAGIPIAHKDNFCTQGIKTSAASRMLDNFIAPYNATVVEKLAQAGTIALGKTNMDEFATGASGQTSFYGPSKNPWSLDRAPGGSSSGSAAAVAAGLVAAATASDTGGSIRQPAAFCGVTGIKPTYGRVSRHGLIAAASSFDQAGVIARSAQDCADVLSVMAGFDENDGTSSNASVPNYFDRLDGNVRGLRIGLPSEFFEKDLSVETRQALEQALAQLESLGAKLVEVSMPFIKQSQPVYQVLSTAELSSNMSRYDGVRFGYRCNQPKDLEDLYVRSRGEGLGDEVKRRILTGTYVLSEARYESHYRQAQKIRRLIHQQVETTLQKVDILAAPVTASPAFKLDTGSQNLHVSQKSHEFTRLANLAGIPAMSLPAGFDQGLPVGLQLLGAWFDEARLLNTAYAFEQATDWHQQIPTAFAAK